MNELLLYAVVIIGAGIFSLVMAIRLLVDKSFGEKYIKENPKAFIGEECSEKKRHTK